MTMTPVTMNWIGWALLSATFAAATALLAKIGVAHVDSNLATALRTTVVVVFAWAIALTLGKPHGGLTYRGRVWLDVDPDRTGLVPALWKKDARFEDYIEWALDVPMFLFKRDGHAIHNTGQTFRGFWQSQGWDDAAPYQTESRIDAPRDRDAVPAGALAVGGVAFAGDRGIQSVEVSTDAGQTWQAAQVKPGLSPDTWQLWRADVQEERGTHEIRVRATDGLGHLQTR